MIGKDGFQVSLDVRNYRPSEISVKTEDNEIASEIVVHAKHALKSDSIGRISREFTRRYDLPKEFKPEDVSAKLSYDGTLTIKAPQRKPAEAIIRQVPIQETGPARFIPLFETST